MNFKIHRGTQEIGGSCVEVWTETTRIVVDIGMPLVDDNGDEFNWNAHSTKSVDELRTQGILPDIDGFYYGDERTVDAIIISHYHADHHGFLSFADLSIPVYCGAATESILQFSESFFKGKPLGNTFRNFTKEVSFEIGDITVTPYWMDHSAYDAYGFLIESHGKTIFYSGDFRSHGRKSKVFDRFLHIAPKEVDYLLMEGTTIGRGTAEFESEQEIEEQLVRLFDGGHGINLINVSGQNIDRLVGIYRACKRTGKTMVIDVYTAAILAEMSKFGTVPHASSKFPEIKVMFPYRLSQFIVKNLGEKFLFKFQKFKITKEQIGEQQADVVMLVRPSMKGDLDRIVLTSGNIIYSMWGGYLKKSPTRGFIGSFVGRGFNFHQIHTSGHADVATLQRLVAAIQPKQLVPIHTFDSDKYFQVFPSTPISRLRDGQIQKV